jgi:hypothetical protein
MWASRDFSLLRHGVAHNAWNLSPLAIFLFEQVEAPAAAKPSTTGTAVHDCPGLVVVEADCGQDNEAARSGVPLVEGLPAADKGRVTLRFVLFTLFEDGLNSVGADQFIRPIGLELALQKPPSLVRLCEIQNGVLKIGRNHGRYARMNVHHSVFGRYSLLLNDPSVLAPNLLVGDQQVIDLVGVAVSVGWGSDDSCPDR